jgi:hypothetical protein
MHSSKQIAGLLGPTLVAMLVSEFPLVQPHLYDAQIPPVVYLSGVLMFIGGLAIVRVHNHWSRNWTVLVTLTGWCSLMLGLVRMFGASAYLRGSANTSSTVFMFIEGLLIVVGLIMTFKAYSHAIHLITVARVRIGESNPFSSLLRKLVPPTVHRQHVGRVEWIWFHLAA